jgi:NAD(P)-dependent dehydrogenase (short-subunit alcohol dehydrogenase family)
LSDISSARRAAAEIVALDLPVAGLLNNAGIMPNRAGRSAQGWDLTFATDHLGPFAFTETLMPHLPDGANVVFVCSGVEDPERKPRIRPGPRSRLRQPGRRLDPRPVRHRPDAIHHGPGLSTLRMRSGAQRPQREYHTAIIP